MSTLNVKPWNEEEITSDNGLFHVKGMLGREERLLLYWLGKIYYSGIGEIIDAGAFIGSSAYCLASGLRKNPSAKLRHPCIHSYDLFEALDDYVAEAITRDVRPLRLGENYIDVFRNQTLEFLDLIKTYEGDLCSHHWNGSAIEILFIDVAKTQELNSHILREFFPSLIPGRSIVVQQDFYHIWHPYIHVTMEYLRDYFEIIDHRVEFQSRVYRLKESIPNDMIEKAADYKFSYHERVELLHRSAESSPSPTREMLRAINLFEAANTKDEKEFLASLKRFELAYPDYRNTTELWARQACEVIQEATARFDSTRDRSSFA